MGLRQLPTECKHGVVVDGGDFLESQRCPECEYSITPDIAKGLGAYSFYRKTTATQISDFTVPPGTPYETPEGLRAEDEETRVAWDAQGGVYPIRESVFRATYERLVGLKGIKSVLPPDDGTAWVPIRERDLIRLKRIEAAYVLDEMSR
jgi:hypothetical protein